MLPSASVRVCELPRGPRSALPFKRSENKLRNKINKTKKGNSSARGLRIWEAESQELVIKSKVGCKLKATSSLTSR